MVGVALPADAKPAELVKPSKASLHDPALGAESGAVVLATPGDQWPDAPGPELATVLVVVIAPVGKQPVRAPARTADLAGNRHNAIDQWQELSDVVAVSACEGDRQRQPAGVGQQVVL